MSSIWNIKNVAIDLGELRPWYSVVGLYYKIIWRELPLLCGSTHRPHYTIYQVPVGPTAITRQIIVVAKK